MKVLFNNFNVPGSGADEWLTPPAMLHALGEFDLDPCAAQGQPWPTAKRMLTIQDDGLSMAWSGRVWLNPPYGRAMKKWLAKLAAHGNGIALVFARTDTDVFHAHVFGKATALLFLRGRIPFLRINHDTGRAAPTRDHAPAPSVLIAYDSAEETTFNSEALRKSGLDGAYVDLGGVMWFGWKSVVAQALAEGPRELQEIYTAVEQLVDRPTNKHIRPKVRQTLYVYERLFARVGDRWALRAA
jgi:hypothetical protein